MKSKLSLFTAAMVVAVTAIQPFAIAADSASIAEASQENTKASGELALDNIQDVAYTLQRIHQQAINVYVESTRKPVSRYELDLVSLCSIPSTPLESPSVYLPLRKAWLVFFIGTMEPLVQILNEHLKHIDERTKQKHLSDQCLPEWQGIVSEWKNTIKQLNEQLDICATLVNDSEPCNVKVAESARSIDDQVSHLNSILHRASKFLQDNLPSA